MGMVDHFVHCCSQNSPPDCRMGMCSQHKEINSQILGNSQNRIGGLAEIYVDLCRQASLLQMNSGVVHDLRIIAPGLLSCLFRFAHGLCVFWNPPNCQKVKFYTRNLGKFCDLFESEFG